MSGRKAALAVFVKTPGLSPIKTRLAATLGRDGAEAFYRLSVNAVEATVATVTESCDVCPYWAVAENDGMADPRWQRFPRISQGSGTLGERLNHVVVSLKRQHDSVLVIGGDSPQISPDIIREAFHVLRQCTGRRAHALGRCHDGGFYLVGIKPALPHDIWCNIPYSSNSAADCLAANLAAHGEVVELPTLTDADRKEDLATLRKELEALTSPSPEQLAVLNWIRQASYADYGKD